MTRAEKAAAKEQAVLEKIKATIRAYPAPPDEEELDKAIQVYMLLKPSLKMKEGHVLLGSGYHTKTILGLYRVLRRIITG